MSAIRKLAHERRVGHSDTWLWAKSADQFSVSWFLGNLPNRSTERFGLLAPTEQIDA
jgi:hypothetical protein